MKRYTSIIDLINDNKPEDKCDICNDKGTDTVIAKSAGGYKRTTVCDKCRDEANNGKHEGEEI